MKGGIFHTNKPVFTIKTPCLGWEVKRTLKNFIKLRATLSNIYPGTFIPPSPPKRLIHSSEASNLEKQQFFLQRFVDSLMRSDLLKSSPFVLGFLNEKSEKVYAKL